MPRHFHDDDFDDRPHADESSSAKPILLVILGVLAIIGLGGAAAGGRYLRLKRLDTSESLIVAVTTGQLKAPVKYGPGQPIAPGQPILPGPPVPWNGTNAVENGARHLGIPDGTLAMVAILTDDFG